MLWVGSLFISFAGQLKCPFNLKTHVLQLWKISLYYFFHNFLPSVFTVLAIRNSSESDTEPVRLSCMSLIILSHFQYFCTFILLFNYFFVCFTFQGFSSSSSHFTLQFYFSNHILTSKSSNYRLVLFPQHPVFV